VEWTLTALEETKTGIYRLQAQELRVATAEQKSRILALSEDLITSGTRQLPLKGKTNPQSSLSGHYGQEESERKQALLHIRWQGDHVRHYVWIYPASTQM